MNQDTILAVARRVIGREAEALATLRDAVGDGFVEAVEFMAKARGRVIVSGIGKSGHIARKIAATLASTGTPAQFVHPAEASHGDLGMVTSDDVALVLSYSGEAPELANLVAYTRRFKIPLIALSGNGASSLVKASDIALILPRVEEACDNGLVPTTSTTMTLALGDALAICLMEMRQFTPADFREFHPGGHLGARLTRVSDIMHRDMPLVTPETPMAEALLTISRKGFGVVGVVRPDGALGGIITDGDLRRHMDGLLSCTAADVMTSNPLTTAGDALAEEALAVMNARKVTCLFVVDGSDGAPVGILHIHDCLRAGVA